MVEPKTGTLFREIAAQNLAVGIGGLEGGEIRLIGLGCSPFARRRALSTMILSRGVIELLEILDPDPDIPWEGVDLEWDLERAVTADPDESRVLPCWVGYGRGQLSASVLTAHDGPLLWKEVSQVNPQ